MLIDNTQITLKGGRERFNCIQRMEEEGEGDDQREEKEGGEEAEK